MEKLFLNSYFKLFKANTNLLNLEQKQVHLLKSVFAKYLLEYSTSDALEDYSNTSEIEKNIQLKHESTQINESTLSYISIRCANLMASQVLILITPDAIEKVAGSSFQTLLLAKCTSNVLRKLFLQVIQSFDAETPLIIKEVFLPENFVKNVSDSISKSLLKLESPSYIIGDVELTYSTSELVTGDSLKNIIINIPEADIAELMDENGLLSNVERFLKKSTSVSFALLPLTKISCHMFVLDQEGKLMVSGKNLHLLDSISFDPARFESSNPLPTNESEISTRSSSSDTSTIPSIVWYLIRCIAEEQVMNT